MSSIADRVRRARLERGLTQASLAIRCGLSEKTIRRIESRSATGESKRRHSMETILSIAEVLDVSTDWLFRGDEAA